MGVVSRDYYTLVLPQAKPSKKSHVQTLERALDESNLWTS